MKSVIRLILAFSAVLLFHGTSLGNSSLTTWYANTTCVVKSTDSSQGLVYVSDKNTTPKDEEYQEEVSVTNHTSKQNTSDTAPGNFNVTFYLKAKPAEGYKFEKWVRNGETISTQANYTWTYSHSTGTQDPNSTAGISTTVTAYFIPDNDVSTEVNIPAGYITLDPIAPHVGDMVTASTFVKPIHNINGNPEATSNKNVMMEFDHWEDDKGNNLGTDETITFKVEREMTLKAIFREIGEIPRPGKYYRVRNAWNRVLTVAGNYSVSVTGPRELPQTLLRWALPLDHNYDDFHTSAANNDFYVTDAIEPICPESEPGTIFYIEEGTLDNAQNPTTVRQVSLTGQDVNTYNLMKQRFNVVKMNESNFPGYLGVTATIAGQNCGLKTVNRDNQACVNLSGFQDTSLDGALAIQPIDEEHVDYFWFGASPDEKMFFDGRWWTTMYTTFPYKCYEPDGVEAYYLKEAFDENGTAYVMAQELEGGNVPAHTAVLLRCRSIYSKENRLIPLDPDQPMALGLEENLLKGVLQLYENEDGTKGREAYDDSTMKVFGFNQDGEVGFYSTPDPDSEVLLTLPANRCYLDTTLIPEPEEEGTTRDAFKLTTYDILTGIKFVPATQENTDEVIFDGAPIYDLMGRRIRNPQPGTIYIVNGKKLVWR